MNEKEQLKKVGDKIADLLNKHYVQEVMPKHGDLMKVFPDGVPEKYKRKEARMEAKKAPIKITEDGKLIIEYKGEQFDLMSEEAKDCHVKEGFNISRYKRKEARMEAKKEKTRSALR